MRTYNRLPVAFVDGRRRPAARHRGQRVFGFSRRHRRVGAGPRHPSLVQAIQDAADGVLHTSNLYHIEAQARLAARLAALSGLDRAFFCNSGAEANEAAIKLARAHARQRDGGGRYKIVSALNSFHGRTMGAMTATGQPKYQDGFGPLPDGFEYVPLNDVDGSGGGGGRADRGGDSGADPRRIGRPPVHVRVFAGGAAHLRREGRRCSFSTRCKRASDAPAACSPSSTTACGPTS